MACFVDGSAGFTLQNTHICKPHFYCPNSVNATTLPQFCTPSTECSGLRLLGSFCEPQGPLEPRVCPDGFYCPTQYDLIICPKGSFCPTGSIKPLSCAPLSTCAEGSISQHYYGGLVICVIIDIILVAGIYLLRYMEHRRVKRQNHYFDKADRSKSTLIQSKLAVRESVARTNDLNTSDPAVVAGNAPNGLTEQDRSNSNKRVFPVTQLESQVDLSAEPDTESSPNGEEEEEEMSANTQVLVDAFKRGLGGSPLQMNFRFESLGLKLKGKNSKTILEGVNGEIRAGRMTAIMGPSGAGKTTFMNVLMGKVTRTHGKLFINNTEAEMHTYKKIIGYVPQEDIMLRELTVRENILHAARVKLPTSWTKAETEAYTDAVVDALNLTGVRHNLIGDETTRGVSGGQRKRVNIGLELAAVPLALFLDEPTSGLDSTAALSVAKIMKSISRLGLTIVAVIHQPRYEIFREFDDLLMIAPGGRTAFMGPSGAAQPYFEEFGFEFDPRANPADILMDILSGHGINKTRHMSVKDLVAAWDQRSKSESTSPPVRPLSILPPPKHEESQLDSLFHTRAPELVKERGSYWWQQIWYCHNRYMIQQYRLISALALEIFVGCFAGLLMGAAVQGSGEMYRGVLVEPYTLISAAPLLWFIPQIGLLIGLIVGLAGAPAGVNVFSQEKPVYWRESASGHNRGSYFIGKSVASIYRFILSSLHFTAIYVFFASPTIDFGRQYLIILLQFFGVYGLAAIVSQVVKRENANLLALIIALFAAVFCGYGPSLRQAKNWHIIFIWEMSFNKWAAEALYSESVKYYEGVYDLAAAATHDGYTLNTFGRNMGMIVLIGVVQRLVAFVLMIATHRDKQR
ncbi:hypothetical protein DFS34DRAFT_390951 [Phlyctochytrium arcticum]|nr:hypothetical protein DFS34DRAFT_390951 [Phlyctochytrium arcticum]